MNDLPRTFAALSDATRLSLVEQMMRNGEMPAGAFLATAGISAPAISRHLKVLREAGLVNQRVKGTHRFYSVRPEALRMVAGWTLDHRAFWTNSLDRLDDMLALDPEGDTP